MMMSNLENTMNNMRGIVLNREHVKRSCTEGQVDTGDTQVFSWYNRFLMKPEAYQELKVVWVNVSHGNQGDMAVRKDKVDTSLPFQYVIGLYDTKRERAVQVHSNGVFQHMGECLQAIQNRIEQGFYWEKKI